MNGCSVDNFDLTTLQKGDVALFYCPDGARSWYLYGQCGIGERIEEDYQFDCWFAGIIQLGGRALLFYRAPSGALDQMCG